MEEERRCGQFEGVFGSLQNQRRTNERKLNNMAYLEGFGERVKALRKQQGITLRQLAADTGLSFGYLSKIEHGIHTPSNTVVQKLSHALKSTDNALTLTPETSSEPDANASFVLRKDKRSLIYGATDLFRFEAVYDLNPNFKLNVMTMYPGCQTQVNSIHNFDELVVVTEGQLTIELEGGEIYDLTAGDCVMVRAQTHHSTRNLLPTRCVSYWFELLK